MVFLSIKSLPNLLFGVVCLPRDRSHPVAQPTINPLACCICWARLLGRAVFPPWNKGPNSGSYNSTLKKCSHIYTWNNTDIFILPLSVFHNIVLYILCVYPSSASLTDFRWQKPPSLCLPHLHCKLYTTLQNCYCWFSHYVSDSVVIPWTVAYQVPLFMGLSRQEFWGGLPLPSPGDLPNPGIKPASPALVGRIFTTESPGKPALHIVDTYLIFYFFNELRNTCRQNLTDKYAPDSGTHTPGST